MIELSAVLITATGPVKLVAYAFAPSAVNATPHPEYPLNPMVAVTSLVWLSITDTAGEMNIPASTTYVVVSPLGLIATPYGDSTGEMS